MPDSDSEPTVRSRSADPQNPQTNSTTAPSSRSTPSTQRGWPAVQQYIATHKISFILALTRVITVLCTISYLIGIPGPASNRYKQVLLMNAATSSLRLHQRMPPPPLSQIGREYFMGLYREDSLHYLLFPIMFIMGQPITLALLPCVLYAIFNLAVYAITILDILGGQEALRTEISNLVTKYQQSLLHTIALSEIALMPVTVIGVFTKAVGISTPIFYYRFLVLRYNSTRNAHLKLLLAQIKATATTYASRYLRR